MLSSLRGISCALRALSINPAAGIASSTPSYATAKVKAPTGAAIKRPPPSAFVLFYQEKAGHLKDKHPKCTGGELMKFAGEEWRAMSEATKQPYLKEWQTLQQKYKTALEMDPRSSETKAKEEIELGLKKLKHNERLKSEEQVELEMARTRRLLNKVQKDKPKKVINGYNLFVKEKRPPLNLKEAAKLWSNLPMTEKTRYHEQAEVLKARDAVKMHMWKEKMKSDGQLEHLEQLIIKMKDLKALKKKMINWSH